METQFHHSIKLPTQYRAAAKLLKKTFEEGASLKGLIFGQKHAIKNRLYALIVKISKQKHVLDRLIVDTKIAENEPRLDKYVCLVLMTELLFGTGNLKGESKQVQCILKYEEQFRKFLAADNNYIPSADTNETTVTNNGTNTTHNQNQVSEFEKPRYVRVNTNLLSRAEAMEFFLKDGWNEISIIEFKNNYDKFLETVRNLGDYDFISDIHVKNLFVFPSSSRKYWAKNQYVQESKLILQDKASCLPTILLDPPRGSTVLDMCAAPGMKSTHLASHMKNKGVIYAVERHQRRFQTLCDFVRNTKSTIIHTINDDALTLNEEAVPNAEYILVDPSCSGSGMTNRLFGSTENEQSERLINLSGLQARMVTHAMNTFPKAKRIVYSTCSIYPQENENVVTRCLERCPGWELIKPVELAENWKHFGSSKYKHVGKQCFYAKPEIDLTDGFFVAVFQRRENYINENDANATIGDDYYQEHQENDLDNAENDLSMYSSFDDEKKSLRDKWLNENEQDTINEDYYQQENGINNTEIDLAVPLPLNNEQDEPPKKKKKKKTINDPEINVKHPDQQQNEVNNTDIDLAAHSLLNNEQEEPEKKKKKKKTLNDPETNGINKREINVAEQEPAKKKKSKKIVNDSEINEINNTVNLPVLSSLNDEQEPQKKKKKKNISVNDLETNQPVSLLLKDEQELAKKKKKKKTVIDLETNEINNTKHDLAVASSLNDEQEPQKKKKKKKDKNDQ